MGTKVIQNKRPPDGNLGRNAYPTNYERAPQVTLPTDFIKTVEERQALAAALETFLMVSEMNPPIKLAGRDYLTEKGNVTHIRAILARLNG